MAMTVFRRIIFFVSIEGVLAVGLINLNIYIKFITIVNLLTFCLLLISWPALCRVGSLLSYDDSGLN